MNKILFFLALFFLATGCIDDINLPVPSTEQKKLSVVGAIQLQDSARIFVELARSVDVSNRFIPEPETGAIVSILSEHSHKLVVPEIRPGTYAIQLRAGDASFPVKAGNSYQLSILLANGENYESNFEMLPPVPEPDSMSVRLLQRSALNESGNIVIEDIAELSIHTPLTTGLEARKTHLKWDFEGCYEFDEIPRAYPLPSAKKCYIKQILNLDKIPVFNASGTHLGRLDGFAIHEEKVDYRFALGYYIIAHQQSLSEGASDYWEKVSQIVSRTGSFFEPPVGVIASNIHNVKNPKEEVLGYFYCSEIATVYRKVLPKEVNNPRQRCYDFSSYNTAAPYCQDCLTLSNSSDIKPAYWK